MVLAKEFYFLYKLYHSILDKYQACSSSHLEESPQTEYFVLNISYKKLYPFGIFFQGRLYRFQD